MKLMRNLLLGSAIAIAAINANAGEIGFSPEEMQMFMSSAGMNKDGMVSKKDLMKKVEEAMKKADPNGKGMYDAAMIRKFFDMLYPGGGGGK
jgi:hypothetical protein